MPVSDNEISYMDHSYQEIDAAVTQVGVNTAAIAAETSNRTTADNKLIAALTRMLDVDAVVQKNLMPLNSGTTTGGYFCENLSIDVPAGTYEFIAKRDTAGEFTVVIKSASDSELYRWSRSASPGVADVEETVTLASDAAKISIYVGTGVTLSNVGIIPKAYYDISPAFVPYPA